MPKNKITSSDLEAQRVYTKRVAQSGFDFGLTVADAFIRGIREIGYKHTGTALDELIDNAIQAEAQRVAIEFAYDTSQSEKKPAAIAIADDGHGMDPDMIRLAIIWGGTHRENNRKGFGRFGYGLPSASVSQGRRFTVYSKVEGGQLFAVGLDLDEINKNTDSSGKIIVPEPQPAELPQWVDEAVSRQLGTFTHGTVVVIDKLDRLSWVTATALKRKLQQHFGVVYRNMLRTVELTVDGSKVDPIDPLFLTPGARHYDLDDVRAVALDPLQVTVKDDRGQELGAMTVRFAYMPPAFTKTRDKGETGDKTKGERRNPRLNVMADHNGVIVLRNHRQIDVVTRCPWTTFQNNDRYWAVELDFPASLDEEFAVTTSKQQIGISDRIWEILREHGVFNAIRDMRAKYTEALAVVVGETDQKDTVDSRPSEQAMADADKFIPKRPGEPPVEKQEKSTEALQREVQRRAEEARMPAAEVERVLLSEIEGHPYRLTLESSRGGPFYRVEQVGGQKVLILNTAHRFYTDVYMGKGSNPQTRWGIEVLLFVFGSCELDATGDRSVFYETERSEWSRRLHAALDRLAKLPLVETMEDAATVHEELQDYNAETA